MPLVLDKSIDHYHVMIWKIDEPLSFFAQQTILNKQESEAYHQLRFEKRKLEWMAARYTQRLLVPDSLIKDKYGKPHLKNTLGYVSISHCKGYAAALFSKDYPVGVDIEPIHEKILRIAPKYTSKTEFDFISETNKIEQLLCNWCLKEAVYKRYGKKELDFKKDIYIQAYNLTDNKAFVKLRKEFPSITLTAHFELVQNIMLAFV